MPHGSEETTVNRFAFVVHPLSVDFIHQHPHYRWSRYLPDGLVEAIGAWFPPLYLGRIRGGHSPATGQRIEGYLYTLGATPRQMLRHSPAFTYARLRLAARMAEQRGARILGLGAFTSVIGDGGLTLARQVGIAITSGNSLTAAVTLETARQAVLRMAGLQLAQARAMVIGASGAIGSACARLLAREAGSLALVSKDAHKLEELQRRILAETPQARVTSGTRAEDLLAGCDLVITATSAIGQRVLDITRCKPGAVICDVARPPNVSAPEAALRPDVLVIESGEVLVPGDVDFGYDLGLPPKITYACLAETMLLAMEGRFEDYTLGRDIAPERVSEIFALFQKHGFQLAVLRSFDKPVSEDDLAHRRALADELRTNGSFQKADPPQRR